MGLESYKETGDKGGITVSVAAKIFLLDIEFAGSQVVRVAINFENTPGPSVDLAPLAAAIFQETLNPTKRKPSYSKPILPPSLAEFSENLQRLALTDKLSKTGLNCFTAITTIYESLRKIYNHEKESLGHPTALCFGSGYPQMHARRKIGLSIDYWRSRRTIPVGEDNPDVKRWRVVVEVQEIPPELSGGVEPVRLPNQWVSDEIHKPKEDNLFGDVEELAIDWLEPPHEEFPDTTGDTSHPRTPPARFSARLDPPLTLPLYDEVDPTLTASFPNHITNPGPLVSLLFPNLEVNQYTNRRVHIPGGLGEITHAYRLYSDLKPVYSRTVSEVPFSHPKDLIAAFKVLRQYALLETLLASCFSREQVQEDTNHGDGGDLEKEVMDLEAFLAEDCVVSVPLRVDIALLPERAFGIDVAFPLDGDPVHLNIIVERNGELKVMIPEGGLTGVAAGLDVRAFEKGLRASEDIPLMIEWFRRSCLGLL
ncbi:hypothetical protein EX30DRAFT_339027 [Ascodesmis nigricans]|uniref:Mediator of RNA polymerase II transcription subunit 1 n=1 Tax=Ascodesmis nigricans TaxID=341454 RepID=A0A4S2N0U8_9PEZI|nr:hypothetical protein EX30DRAFT_339027 [Ascodesmis nigricans]